MSLLDEFKAKNFSLYGQWVGILSILLLIILGILRFTSHWVFSMVGWIIALLLVVLEIPLCIKFCPMSPKFDKFIGYFENCYFRAVVYLVFSVVMFLANLTKDAGSFNACAVFLLLAAALYGFAGYKGQAYASSTVLGGTGVDNVV